jgi:hypothetical protein
MKTNRSPINFRIVIICGSIVFIFLLFGSLILVSLFSFQSNNLQLLESEITIIAYSTITSKSNSQYDKDVSISTPDPNYNLFYMGIRVSIYGTGGEGLRVHQLPGQDSPTIYLANEDSLYTITDGPIITGGYVWWQIKSINEEEIIGWAVQDYLQVNINSQ